MCMINGLQSDTIKCGRDTKLYLINRNVEETRYYFLLSSTVLSHIYLPLDSRQSGLLAVAFGRQFGIRMIEEAQDMDQAHQIT